MAKAYGIWHYQRRPEVTEEEFEQAARELVAYPLPAGWHVSFMKADRGEQVGRYVRLWEIDSTETRDRIATAEGITAEGEQWFADNPGWVALQEKLDALALEPTWTDFVVLASR
jgi:hypothetical protein